MGSQAYDRFHQASNAQLDLFERLSLQHLLVSSPKCDDQNVTSSPPREDWRSTESLLNASDEKFNYGTRVAILLVLTSLCWALLAGGVFTIIALAEAFR